MKLVLENGQEFHGLGYGSQSPVVGEIVFNTSMVGYQEIASDPAYAGQLVVMTYPLIGQYGITDDDFESRIFSLGGLIVREYCDTPSNFRYTKTLSEEMDEHGIPILSGPDTRMLTRIIRTEGSMKAAIVDEGMSTGTRVIGRIQDRTASKQFSHQQCIPVIVGEVVFCDLFRTRVIAKTFHGAQLLIYIGATAHGAVIHAHRLSAIAHESGDGIRLHVGIGRRSIIVQHIVPVQSLARQRGHIDRVRAGAISG